MPKYFSFKKYILATYIQVQVQDGNNNIYQKIDKIYLISVSHNTFEFLSMINAIDGAYFEFIIFFLFLLETSQLLMII